MKLPIPRHHLINTQRRNPDAHSLTSPICLLSPSHKCQFHSLRCSGQNRGVSITLQLTHQGILVPLPSKCTLNQTTSHHCTAIDLVQDTSLSYLDWCGSFLTGLSASTLDPTFFSLHSKEILQNTIRPFSAPNLQRLHTSLG